MSFVINYGIYKPLFESDNVDVIKNALQAIYEEFIHGHSIYRKDIKHFTLFLEKCINSPSTKIRKWAYHCASFYSNETIIRSCIRQLSAEKNSENILWNISALFADCKTIDEVVRKIPPAKFEEFHDTISPNFLEISALFASKYDDPILIKELGESYRKSDLMAFTKLYGYPSLVKENGVNQEAIMALQNNDDETVREYVYWALFKNPQPINYASVKADFKDEVDVLKWQYAVIISEGDKDRIASILRMVSNNKNTHFKIKSGIAIGLIEASYHLQYTSYIAKWYNNEIDPYIRQLLLQYMIINCKENINDGTFLDIINLEVDSDDFFRGYIVQVASKRSDLQVSIGKKTTIKLKGNASIMKNNTKSLIAFNNQGKSSKLTVLFLAANPQNTPQLALDEEARAIQNEIRRTEFRDFVGFETRWAVKTSDILQAINEIKPTVIHFSGHGAKDGSLVLYGSSGGTVYVSEDAIAATIATVSDTVKLVVFNTCFSSFQAEKIVKHIDAAVGMSDSISDSAACIFAAQLYSSIGFGCSLDKAYNQARARLMLEGIPEENTPKLYTRDILDPCSITLVDQNLVAQP